MSIASLLPVPLSHAMVDTSAISVHSLALQVEVTVHGLLSAYGIAVLLLLSPAAHIENTRLENADHEIT